MDPRLRKISCIQPSGSDSSSPVLLRRRLSAPETVMRKYKLDRARSQENDSSCQGNEKFGELSSISHGGSDFNLQKKKDSAVLMRKSTLLRRLMNNSKSIGSSSFHEWQHYCGKLSTSSLSSLQSSPEHQLSKSYSRRSLVGCEFKTSPKHVSRKVSPVHQLYDQNKSSQTQNNNISPKRKIGVCHEKPLDQSIFNSQLKNKSVLNTELLSSRKSNINNTDSTKNASMSHSDSAYSNDRSDFSTTSTSSTSTNTNVTTQQSSIHYHKEDKGLKKKNPPTESTTLIDENRNFSVNTTFNYATQEISTQTSSRTNLNVISNVKLSQQTLDLIVNEVMRDVQKICTNGNEVEDKKVESHVKKVNGLWLKTDGTNDNPPQEVIPKHKNQQEFKRTSSSTLSFLSGKTSTSGHRSDNFTDDNSDVASLADSLEETSLSSRMSLRNHDEKPVRGDLPQIHKSRSINNLKPADAFYVPMKLSNKRGDDRSVSDYLPEKLKENILKRQQDIHSRLSSSRENFSGRVSTDSVFKERTNSIHTRSSSSQSLKKSRPRHKRSFLPSIISKKTEAENSDVKKSSTKRNKDKNKRKLGDFIKNSKKKDILDERHEERYRSYKTENRYIYNGLPKTIYHKSEFRNCNKRIEILEIMECLDFNEKPEKIPSSGNKSKIPIFVDKKRGSTTIDRLTHQPTFLDFDKLVLTDLNLDRLIANILIQTMNEENTNEIDENNEETVDKTEDTGKKIEAIPEESSTKIAFFNNENDDNENFIKDKNSANVVEIETINENCKENNNIPKNKEVPEDNSRLTEPKIVEEQQLLMNKNPLDLPEGWVAFYIPRKSSLSMRKPSIDDHDATKEGRTLDVKKGQLEENEGSRIVLPDSNYFAREDWQRSRKIEAVVSDECNRNSGEKEDIERTTVLPPSLMRRHGQSVRRSRYKNSQGVQHTSDEWSIVLSGNNNANQLPPDLEMRIKFPYYSSHSRCCPEQLKNTSGKNFGNEMAYDESTESNMNEKLSSNFSSTNTSFKESNGEVHNLRGITKKGIVTDKTQNERCFYEPIGIRDFRPRQTRTSMRRYKMTRPKLQPLFEPNTIYESEIDRQYPDLFRRFPQLLGVYGNSLSQERKTDIPTMLRRSNLPKHNCSFHKG